MKILFFHGGPGLNSNPERKLLSAPFAEAGFELICWNEPSALRAGGASLGAARAYDRYLGKAEEFFLENFEGEPLVALAHSFGANAACHVADRHPEKLAHVVFVSSDLVPSVADLNVFRFVSMDYKETGDARYRDLQEIIDRYSGKFDPNTEAGFGLVVQNPRWFDYYWLNRQRMGAFAPHYAEPGYTVDAEGFFNIRRAYHELEMPQGRVPATAVFGKHDIVVSRDIELSVLRKRFQALRVHDFDRSAHYPHVEETEEFLRVMSRALAGKEPAVADALS